jgi:hypothetical protein
MPHIWIIPFVLADAQYSNPAHWSATTAIAQISDWKLAQGKLIQGKLIQGKLIQRRRGCKGPSEPFAKLAV